MPDAITWTPVTVRLDALDFWAHNPKRLSKAQAARLEASTDRLGRAGVLLVGPPDAAGRVPLYDGHQRANVWRTLYGLSLEVHALQSDRPLTEDERLSVSLLTVTATGSLDFDALAAWDTDVLQSLGLGAEYKAELDDTAANIAAMLDALTAENVEPVDAEPQVDRAEELREKWGVELGQMWQLGEHRLICGDCTDAAVVARVMGGERAHMCFTSPPYNAGKTATEQKTGAASKYADDADNKSGEDYLRLLQDFTRAALSVCDYVFVNIQVLSGNKAAFVNYQIEFLPLLCDYAVWDKQTAQPAMARRVMDSRFEFVLVFGGNGTRAIGTRDFRGMVHNVYSGSTQRHNENADIHAATFPLDLPAHFIRTFTNDGEFIFEPFDGTGTTLIACENLGRKCRAIEISPAYVAVALERWATATGKTPVRVDTP